MSPQDFNLLEQKLCPQRALDICWKSAQGWIHSVAALLDIFGGEVWDLLVDLGLVKLSTSTTFEAVLGFQQKVSQQKICLCALKLCILKKAFETVLWAAELTQFGMCDTEKTKEKAPAWAIVPVTASTGPKPLRVLETRSPLTLLTLRLQGRSCSLLLVFGDAGSGRIGKGSGDASTVSGWDSTTGSTTVHLNSTKVDTPGIAPG